MLWMVSTSGEIAKRTPARSSAPKRRRSMVRIQPHLNVAVPPGRGAMIRRMEHRARMVGINHVALEVGDVEAAVAFYGSLFALRRVDREPGMAFLDMGDQFLALSQGRTAAPDDARHFGLVVDDKEL